MARKDKMVFSEFVIHLTSNYDELNFEKRLENREIEIITERLCEILTPNQIIDFDIDCLVNKFGKFYMKMLANYDKALEYYKKSYEIQKLSLIHISQGIVR